MKSPARLSNNKKRRIAQLVEQAARALGAGRQDVCEQLCAKIEAIQPGNADAANIRGILCAQAGDVQRAEELFVQAINAAPRRPEFHDNLGKLYLRHKLYADAVERYCSALQYNPNSLDVKLGYCASLLGIGDADEALSMLQPIRSKQPNQPDVLMLLAKAFKQLGRFDDVLECLDGIIARDAGHVGALFDRGVVLLQMGRMQEAEAELRGVLTLRPDYAEVYGTLAEVKRFTSQDDPDVQAMQALHAASGADSTDRLFLCFALAKAYEDLGLFDRAFALYEQGNALRHRHAAYDADAELAHLQAVITAYTPEVVRRTSDLQDARPIFIVGMPRSGSTLVEQILSAHPGVESRGECEAFEHVLVSRQLEGESLTLEQITAFSPGEWREIGEAYLQRIEPGPDAQQVTDKTLENFRLIGAIHCALPRARIIHMRRHPLDNCLSIYKANLTGRQLDYAYSLGGIGYYYRMYQRVMQHWREVLPEGVLYELDYEQLVADQEQQTRDLLAACGLDWNQASLHFTEADTHVETASRAQVRRGMYSGAVGRWKRYEKHLQPLIRILGID